MYLWITFGHGPAGNQTPETLLSRQISESSHAHDKIIIPIIKILVKRNAKNHYKRQKLSRIA